MSESRARGLMRLRHLQEFTEAAGDDMARERERFERLADDSQKPRAVSAFNLFQTPEHLADRMAQLAGPTDDCRVLEPSAGLGRLYRAIRLRSSCHVTLVENSPECCRELYRETEGDDCCRLVQGDFLAFSDSFDVALMNPPFKQGRDVRHILHAAGMCTRVVALCFNGAKQNRDLKPLASSWEIVPAGTFEATRTEAVLLTIN